MGLFLVGCNDHTFDAPAQSNAYERTSNSYLSHGAVIGIELRGH